MNMSEIEFEFDKITIFELIKHITEFTDKDLFNELIQNNKVKPATMILLNGRNIYHLNKLHTIVCNGDIIDIFPPGGGG